MPRPRDEFDEDDDRPRRRRYEDDDEEDRPRRRRKKPPSGPPVGLIVGLVAGVGLVGLLFVAVVTVALLRRDRPVPVAGPAFAPAPVVAPAPAAKAAPPPAPAGKQQVTITAVRRGTGFAGKPTLEIDYSLSGGFVPGQAVVLVKSPQGTTEANIFGLLGMRPGQNTGTWTLEKFGFGGGFGGRLEVWVEQRLGFSGGIISNTFVLDGP